MNVGAERVNRVRPDWSLGMGSGTDSRGTAEGHLRLTIINQCRAHRHPDPG